MLGLSKHGSNFNGVILPWLKVRVKMCENVSAHTVKGALNEGRTGPFVETPATRKQGRPGRLEGWGVRRNESRWKMSA